MESPPVAPAPLVAESWAVVHWRVGGAQAVGDAAAGGMVLLSEASYAQLPMESLWDKALVMHIGEYVLSDSLPRLDLYQVSGASHVLQQRPCSLDGGLCSPRRALMQRAPRRAL